MRVLEAAGVDVVFPAQQTCCGQPALTAGEPDAAARLARHHLDVFGARATSTRSSRRRARARRWCATTTPTLLTDRRADADALAARTFELTQYLVDVLGVDDIGARLDTTVTVHDACHGLRNLGLGRPDAHACSKAAGATLVEMTEADTCCGFGGVFSFGFPEVSTRLADAKLGHAATTSAPLPRERRPRVPDASRRPARARSGRGRAATDPHRRPPRVRARPAMTAADRRRRATGPRPRHHDARATTSTSAPRPRSRIRCCSRRCTTSTAACAPPATSAAAHPDWKDRAAAIRRETLARSRRLARSARAVAHRPRRARAPRRRRPPTRARIVARPRPGPRRRARS